MSRPSFRDLYMQLAEGLAKRSTCQRLNVGCVITSVDNRTIYAIGYNGNYSGGPNCCDSTTPGACGCIHAEENAIINCNVPRYVEKHVYVTHLPCVMCAKRLINLGGVKLIRFMDDYRTTDSIDLFRHAGIEDIARHLR